MRQVGGPSASAHAADQGRKGVQMAEIGGERRRRAAFSLDFGHQRQGLGRGGVIVDADPPAPIREIERDDPAEPAARAGHEHGAGILVLSHAVWLGAFARIELPSDFWLPQSHSK